MGGWGGGPWGGGPWGSLAVPSILDFVVVSATAVDYRTVDITFSHPLAVNPSVINSPGSYNIDLGLTVLSVVQVSSTVVRFFTTHQQDGTDYTVTVSLAIVSSTFEVLTVNTAMFTGIGFPAAYVVTDFEARSDCMGQSIRMTWTNPDGLSLGMNPKLQLLRRVKAWPFDLTDDYDVLVDQSGGNFPEAFLDTGVATPITALAADAAVGDTTITVNDSTGFTTGMTVRLELMNGDRHFEQLEVLSTGVGTITFTTALTKAYTAPVAPIAFIDGGRVSRATDLLPQTYYYYLLVVSKDFSANGFDITDDSRAFALSIDVFNSAEWLTKHTPADALVKDAKPASKGGGDGFLAKWYEIMGCWLNLMRGQMNAMALMGDPEKAPFHVLTAKNQSLGIDPEGMAYDWDIMRRPLTSLVFVYKRKGTCPGIIETVRMFTKWDALCVDFGTNACQSGASTLKTYDGTSLIETITGYSSTTSSKVTDDEKGLFTYSGTIEDPDLWADGTLYGSIGDIACIESSTYGLFGSTLVLKTPTPITTLSAPASIGATSLTVASTVGLVPGLTVQITSNTPSGGFLTAEIVEITSVTPPSTLGLASDLVNAFPTDSVITIGKSIVRAEYRGSTGATAAGQIVTDSAAQWTENQWKGYYLLDSSNVKHAVVSNTGTTVTVDGAAPTSGQYAIATDFTLGASFALRDPQFHVRIANGQHSFLFEPTFDLELRGTIYDPFNRLYGGPGLNLFGVYGPGDIGVYILGDIPVNSGRATTVTSATLTLDPSSPVPTTDEYVGMFLNPNQNQTQLFEILANTTTTVTVAGDITSLVVAGQAYYILRPRDKTRFERITARLQQEFTSLEVRVHVLFV